MKNKRKQTRNNKIVLKTLCVIFAGLMLLSVLCMCTGCNQTMFDTVWEFDRALIELPGGEVIEVDIKQWGDYEDGDQLQIIAEDGTVYLVHSSNCVLIRDK